MMLRRLTPLVAVFVLAGCGFYTGTEKATQTGIAGALQFTVTFCATNATPGAGGASTAGDGTVTEPGDPCGATSSGGSPTRGQGLIALRFPAGVTLPDTLTSADGIVATKSPTYTATFGTPPAGTQIQGYITPPESISAVTAYTATFPVPLPATHPFAGPLKARVLAGWRKLTLPTDDGSGAVVCGGDTTCVTSGSPATDFSFETRDLAVGTPAAGTLDFPLTFKGKAGPTFDLAATTTVPAGSVAPADATFTPTDDQTKTEKVNVTIPPGTDAGTYSVTLTAKLGSETRSGMGTVVVVAPTTTPSPTPTATPVRTATPRPTIVPTVVATPSPTPKPAKVAKKAPKSFTLTVKPTGARSFKARGRLRLPKGVVRADGCAGIVRLSVGKTKKTTIITGACTFSRTLKVTKAGSYKVKATFTGNQFLTARNAKGRRFRAS